MFDLKLWIRRRRVIKGKTPEQMAALPLAERYCDPELYKLIRYHGQHKFIVAEPFWKNGDPGYDHNINCDQCLVVAIQIGDYAVHPWSLLDAGQTAAFTLETVMAVGDRLSASSHDLLCEITGINSTQGGPLVCVKDALGRRNKFAPRQIDRIAYKGLCFSSPTGFKFVYYDINAEDDGSYPPDLKNVYPQEPADPEIAPKPAAPTPALRAAAPPAPASKPATSLPALPPLEWTTYQIYNDDADAAGDDEYTLVNAPNPHALYAWLGQSAQRAAFPALKPKDVTVLNAKVAHNKVDIILDADGTVIQPYPPPPTNAAILVFDAKGNVACAFRDVHPTELQHRLDVRCGAQTYRVVAYELLELADIEDAFALTEALS